MTEVRGQKSDDRNWNAEVGIQKSDERYLILFAILHAPCPMHYALFTRNP